ncbi:TPA: nucleotide pyrophosphohydrolase [Burkholderia vietnamiensis]|nr:nucleotide pyrophosphohydrolase [Burkholderia vietnamiensis]KVE86157.1 nucleotide pyrophosphohydrolase [Burkholderia vietnamiensis]HDR9251443.1 nucleotide pyrophosphohydrolase [Burkholderia vietnamiensis]
MSDVNEREKMRSLVEIIRQFVAERDWEKFHTPKNLVMAMNVEVAELMEPFQWVQSGDIAEIGSERMVAVRHELADVFMYLILLSDKLEVDLFDVCYEKIEINRRKYPADKVRGSSMKYYEYK